MFSRKVALIEKHLKDPEHPLSWLHRSFCQELRDYYNLFIEVNKQNKGVLTERSQSESHHSNQVIMLNVSQRSHKSVKRVTERSV